MPVYSIKNDETLAVRAFSCAEMAYDWGYKQQVFSTQEELYNTNLTDTQLKEVYQLVTGFETRVQYRDYLCELIFNAIEAACLPLTDVDGDCAILSDKEPADNESVHVSSEPVHVSSEPVHIPNDPIEDMVRDIIPLTPDHPTPNPNPEPETVEDEPPAMSPEPTLMEPEPEPIITEFNKTIDKVFDHYCDQVINDSWLKDNVNETNKELADLFSRESNEVVYGIDSEPITDEPPTVDIDPAAFLKLIVNNTFDEPEAKKRMKNAMIYGTSHPEMYRTAKFCKKDLVLSDTPKTKYSRREISIFETIVDAYPEPITTKDIIERKFKSYKKYHVKNSVAVTTKSLASKIAYNEEPFLLKISGNSGPKPMSVWIEEKGETND